VTAVPTCPSPHLFFLSVLYVHLHLTWPFCRFCPMYFKFQWCFYIIFIFHSYYMSKSFCPFSLQFISS
jgi:hypothetical protein